MADPASETPATATRIAYLFSRYPVVSQTFCDSEILALEGRGFEIDIASINPPLNAFRHERFDQLRAEVLYPPPPRVLEAWKHHAELEGAWQERLEPMIARHEDAYGPSFKAATRARNGLYFAETLRRRGVRHVHVHFANRATHTALFIKAWCGLPFSSTAHAQDFMVDLGSDDLLRELCREARFVVAVSDYSAELLRERCPDSADKIGRVYNGITPSDFPAADPVPATSAGDPLRIVSVGRLIEFKGFHHLLAAAARLKAAGLPFELCLIGDGPLRGELEAQARDLGIADEVDFAGIQTQESVKARLAAADVFALACIIDRKGASDILPTVIMEAMACGLPIVSSRLVGVPEMVQDGVTGILTEPGDEAALAEAFQRLKGEGGLARRLGDAGQERAIERFDQAVTSGQLEQKFRGALAEPREETVETPAEARLLYVLDCWLPDPEDLTLEQEVAFMADEGGAEIGFVACQAPVRDFRKGATVASLALVTRFAYLPDAMVLEAEWRHHPERVDELLGWRGELGNHLSTEVYLLHARRALHLARGLARTGVRQLHAARSSSLPTAWLAHRLSGLPFSATIEAAPKWHGSALDTMLGDACLVSRADRPSGESGNGDPGDLLALRRPESPGSLRLGPLKVRRFASPPPAPGERRGVHEHWLATLRRGMSEATAD